MPKKKSIDNFNFNCQFFQQNANVNFFSKRAILMKKKKKLIYKKKTNCSKHPSSRRKK